MFSPLEEWAEAIRLPTLSVIVGFFIAASLPSQPAVAGVDGTGQRGSAHAGESRSITGLITDATRARLPRALVVIRQENGQVAAATQTNERGEFAADLPEGDYRISVNLAGFASIKDRPLEVKADTPPVVLSMEVRFIEEQIVVTATRNAALLPQIGSAVTVVSGTSPEYSGATSVADLLRKMEGLTMVESGGHGQIASLFVRGGESDYSKVLIDGVTVNSPGGAFNFAGLSAADIERVEMVRGPQSALYGSDAIAGTLQVFTRRGTSAGLSPAPRFAVEAGSFSTLRYAVGVDGKGDRADYALSFTRLDTDNDAVNGSFNQETLSANAGWRPSTQLDLRGIFRSDAGRTGVPGPWAIRPPDLEEFYRHRHIAGGVTLTHFFSPYLSQKYSYSVSDSRQFSADPVDSGPAVVRYGDREAPWPSFDYVYQTLNRTRRQRIGYQSDIVAPRGHLLSAGADYERESGVIGDPNEKPLRASRDNYGVYFQDQWAGWDRVFTAAGVRLEHSSSYGFYATPRLSMALHLHRPAIPGPLGLTKLRFNYGLGIKAPELVETYSQSPYFRGNPDLRPEKATSFDAGIEQSFGTGRGTAAVTYFDNRFREQIGYAVTDYQTFEGSFFNIGRTRARGIETLLRMTLGSGWEAGGGYTFLDSAVLESSNPFDPVFTAGQWLLRRPRHSGYLDLEWKPGSWTLAASALMVGRRADSDFAGLGVTHNPGYMVLNLLANFRIGESTSVYAAVNNALNTRYMEVFGYPALRAHFRIGIRAGF
ncbi:MAG: TonB-dependent receptor [Acidobacteria bacterium]|nr:TonB-dependent receptor [Acidobacteriota bacterium]